MKAILFVTLALLIARGHAETASSDSAEFPVELGSARSVAAVTSIEFPVDLRMKGGVGSTGSAEFVLNTMANAVDSLVIEVSPPASVVAGRWVELTASAHFSGAAGVRNVSAAAHWYVIGNAPAGTRFEKNHLFPGDVSVPTVIRVVASYLFPSGGRQTESVAITILPAPLPYKVVTAYSLVGPPALTDYLLSCNAVTSSPEGAALAANVHWDLDQDGTFDDHDGFLASQKYAAGKSVRIGVRAEWPQAGAAPQVASSYFWVTMAKSPVTGEPPSGIALDALNGHFLDNEGMPTTPLASRKATGLIVLTHGLTGAGTNRWLIDMHDAIAARLSAAPPNMVIYDWNEMADPGSNDGYTGLQSILDALVKIRPNGAAQGVMLADWIDRQHALGTVDKTAKIHLIGHSAGGFVVGEAARILNQRGYGHIQITMLDTPLPYHQHIKPQWRTERYISSFAGGNPQSGLEVGSLNAASKQVGSNVERFEYQGDRLSWEMGVFTSLGQGPVASIAMKRQDGGLYSQDEKYFRKVIDPKAYGLINFIDQHSAAHQYYLATISSEEQGKSHWKNDALGDGFNQSFLVNDAVFQTSPQMMRAQQNDTAQIPVANVPPMEGFSTFGDVEQTGSVARVTEAANAGIFKGMTLPVGAATLQLQLQVITPGDGDFVSVHWNDGDALAIIPETSLAYDAPLLHEIDITGLGGQTGTLTFKLMSRGVANSVVRFSEIRILESDDVDSDGLTNAEEAIASSDVFDSDTDGDGIADGDEVHTHGTDPLRADSDGDGQNDAAELAAGTNPLMNGSSLRVTTVAKTALGFMLQWTGVVGKSYRVVRSQELGTFNQDFLKAGLVGVNGLMSYTDPNPPPQRAFYWVEVE